MTQNNGCLDILSIEFVGLTKRCRFKHLRVRPKHFVDVLRGALFATAVNHLLQPSPQEDVAVFVFATEIAATVPPIDKARGVRLRIVQVSCRTRRTSHPDLPNATRWHISSVFVDNSYL